MSNVHAKFMNLDADKSGELDVDELGNLIKELLDDGTRNEQASKKKPSAREVRLLIFLRTCNGLLSDSALVLQLEKKEKKLKKEANKLATGLLKVILVFFWICCYGRLSDSCRRWMLTTPGL